MACKNCVCDAEPTQPAPDKTEEHEKAIRLLVGMMEKLNGQIANVNGQIVNVNRFLQSKYPDDLADGAGVPADCTYWANKVDRLAAQEQRLQNMIAEFKERGYLVEKVSAPEPTLENAVRNVVTANT